MSLFGGVQIPGKPDLILPIDWLGFPKHNATMHIKPIPLLSDSDLERFWAKVDVRSDNECWPWIAALEGHGYGAFMMPGNSVFRAHRLAAHLMLGPIPVGMHVCHKCDNPPCCNPSHLFFGTRFDNFQDCSKKGRTCLQRYPHLARGASNNAAKLTVEQVMQIRMKTESITKTASRFSISVTHVKSIRSGKSWSHL